MPIHRGDDETTRAMSPESDWVDLSASTAFEAAGVELTAKANDLHRMMENLSPPPPLQDYDEDNSDSKSYSGDDDYTDDEDYSDDGAEYNVDRARLDADLSPSSLRRGLSLIIPEFDKDSSKPPTPTTPNTTLPAERKKRKKKRKRKTAGTEAVFPPSSMADEERLEQEQLKVFWLGLDEAERRKFVKVEREAALKMLEEQQRVDCAHTVCGGDDDTHLRGARNVLAILDDLLKNEEQKFIEATERLVEYWKNQEGGDGGGCEDALYKKMEDGKRMFVARVFIARMLEKRVLAAYRESAAQERVLRRLRELEDEVKKAQENRRKRDKKRERKLARESESVKRDAARLVGEQAKRETRGEERRKKRGEEKLRRGAERKTRKEGRRRLAAEEEAKERERKLNKSKKEAGRRTRSDTMRASPGVSNNSLPNLPFYPVGNDRARLLGFARFDDELLRNIQDLNVRVLQNATWQPNRGGDLRGGFGYVERAVWDNQDIAVKFLKGAQTDSGIARGRRSFRRELVAWRQLSHPNILPFLGVVCVDNLYLGMVSPYMPNGPAPKYIATNPDANVLQILYDVAAGLRHLALQKPPIAHGDLKGANVLIDQDGRARICDFGLSKLMKEFMSVDTRYGGTIRWMAPEQLLSETMLVSLQADVFSWGMLVFELMTGSVPWPDVQQEAAVAVKVSMHDQRPARPTCKTRGCQTQPECRCLIGDNDLWALIQRCWLKDPSKRPTAAELCEALAIFPGIQS